MQFAPHVVVRKILKRIVRCIVYDIEHWIVYADLGNAPDPIEESASERIRATSRNHVDRIAKRYGMRFKTIEPEDVEAMIREAPRLRPAEVRARLSDSMGYVFYEGDRLGGWLWTTSSPRPREGVAPLLYEVRPAPGNIYIYDAYVMPVARGHGGIHLLYAHAFDELRRRGYQGVFFTVESGNFNMQRLGERVGFRRVGSLRYKRRLWWSRLDLGDLEAVCQPADPA